jgi:hypothetical protein
MENYTVLSTTALRLRAGLRNIGEAADFVGLPQRRFRYLLESARIFRPQTRIGRRVRSYYTVDEIDRIRRLVGEL